jgi:threonine dehydrogenase-like Zn-dependent dehydrogenase
VAVNPSKENLCDRVMQETGEVGAQVVFDTTPNVPALEDAFRCVGNVGKLVLYSSFYPPAPAEFQPDWIHKNGIRIIGTANSNSRDFVRAAALISEGIIDTRPFISESYPLEQIGAAFESAVAGGKFRVVIKFS